MGIANFTLTNYGRYGGNPGRGNIVSTKFRTSGAHTTSTSASNLEDAGGDVTAQAGEILIITPTEAMWMNAGSGTAAIGTGLYLEAGQTAIVEIEETGTVSVIDVA